MTHEAILALAPGPQTDRLIAEALCHQGPVLKFSTSYDAVWKVVEYIRQRGWMVRIQEKPDGIIVNRVAKQAVCVLYPMLQKDPLDHFIQASAESSVIAILRAFLMWKALHKPAEGQSASFHTNGGTHG